MKTLELEYLKLRHARILAEMISKESRLKTAGLDMLKTEAIKIEEQIYQEIKHYKDQTEVWRK